MKKSINVIFMGSFLYPNGYAATKRKQQFLDYIIAQGDAARILITMKLSKGHELNDLKGIHNSIPYEVIGDNVKPNILFPVTFLIFCGKSFIRLIKYKKRDAKNIIVAFGINFDTILLLFFAKFIGYKIVFDIVEDFSTIKHINGKNKIKYWLLRTLPKYFINMLASGISVISKYLKNKYSYKKLYIPISLVPISASNLFQEEDRKTDNEFSVLYSGTYGEKEGIPVMIEGFRLFSYQRNNVKLILTGNCPVDIRKIVLEKLGGLNNVLFTGRLNDDDYFEMLKNANVLLMTRNNSDYSNAGFPYKLGEYLATGNPVICTKVSDVKVYLKDKVSAFLINPDNSNELCNSLNFIYNNYEIAWEVGRQGREICKRFFNPDKNSKLFYSILEKC